MWKKGATGETLHSMGGGGKLRKGERKIRCDNVSQPNCPCYAFFLPGELLPSSVQNCITGGFPPFSPLKPSPQADAVNQTQEEEEEKRREGSFFPRGKGPPGGKKCMRTLCLPQEALLLPPPSSSSSNLRRAKSVWRHGKKRRRGDCVISAWFLRTKSAEKVSLCKNRGEE